MRPLLEQYEFIQARNYTPASRETAPLIVIHTMESSEKPGTARAVAKWFAGATAPKASAHFCVDQTEVIQCVKLTDVAWHAPGANRLGIGIEHAGRAGQDRQGWEDAASMATLRLSTKLAAELMRECGVSPTRVWPTEIRAGMSGICGHVDVTKAYPGKGSGHWDPGPSFPWEVYISMVSHELARLPTLPDITKES